MPPAAAIGGPDGGPAEDKSRSILDDLGEEVTGIMAPVSICMAVTVLLVKLLNPEGASSASTVYIASIAYSEDESDSSGKKLGGALLNAIIFVAVIAGMTVVLFLLFKYQCYKLIFGYMGFAVFNIFFFITGALFINVMQVINLHIDAFSLAYGLFNFSVVGTLGLLFVPIPLLAKQVYLIWVGIITAYIFTFIPEWTAWVLLVLMALYDIAAVLIPGGPLKALVEMAVERQQELPALIYEARPAGGRPYVRGWGNRAARDGEGDEGGDRPRSAGSDRPRTPAGNAASTNPQPIVVRPISAVPADGRPPAGAVGEGRPGTATSMGTASAAATATAINITHVARSRPTSSTPADHSSPQRRLSTQSQSNSGTHAHLPPPAASGIGRHRLPSNGSGSGAGPVGEAQEGRGPAAVAMVGTSGAGHMPGTYAMDPKAAALGLKQDDPYLQPLIVPGAAAESPSERHARSGRANGASGSRGERGGSAGVAGGAGGAGRDPRAMEAAAPCAPPPQQPPPRRPADDDDDDDDALPDAIKLGLGDFIFYSMLVGRAAMYDFMTVFSCFLAVIAGLGLTLLCLAIFKKALPALPFSIALGVIFYFLTRLTLEPFMVPLSTHFVFF